MEVNYIPRIQFGRHYILYSRASLDGMSPVLIIYTASRCDITDLKFQIYVLVLLSGLEDLSEVELVDDIAGGQSPAYSI